VAFGDTSRRHHRRCDRFVAACAQIANSVVNAVVAFNTVTDFAGESAVATFVCIVNVARATNSEG
jgi:hypothetical protein